MRRADGRARDDRRPGGDPPDSDAPGVVDGAGGADARPGTSPGGRRLGVNAHASRPCTRDETVGGPISGRPCPPDAGARGPRGPGRERVGRYAANDPGNVIDPTGLSSLEVSAYDGIGAGFKLAITDKGVSACVEGGAGVGSSVEFDGLDDLDGNTFGFKGEASGKLGAAKVRGSLEMNLQTDDFGKGECGPEFKGELKACGGPVCVGADTEPGYHFGDDVDVHPDALIPKSGIGEGAEAKFVARVCQQVKW